jgi:hypothetical protein
MENDPDYERKLEQRDPELVKALRYGDWMSFAGQAFPEFHRKTHVIDPIELPEEFPAWAAVDWGYESPFCCLWARYDPTKKRIFIVRELYKKKVTDRKQARMILVMTPENERSGMTFADPKSYWTTQNKDDITYKIKDEYAAEGVVLTKADNNRLSGKNKIHRMLDIIDDGYPGLIIFSNCTNLIRTLPLLTRDEMNPEDVDTDGEDHAYDTCRYLLTNYKLDKPKGDDTSEYELLMEYL